MCSFIGIILLLIFIGSIFIDGISRIDIDFLSGLPSRYADKANINIMDWNRLDYDFTALISIPVGIGAAIYMEEYSAKNRLNTFLEINISNLAGVPSIIYGLLGLEILLDYRNLVIVFWLEV